MSKENISTIDCEILFNHIKEFPLGTRMLMSSARLGLGNLAQIPRNLQGKMNKLDLSNLFALKGVAKDITDQTNQYQSHFSKLGEDMLIKILSYLQIDDIKKLESQEMQLSSQAENTFGEEEFKGGEEEFKGGEEESKEEVQARQTEQTPPNTSPITNNQEAAKLSGRLPTKSCTIS